MNKKFYGNNFGFTVLEIAIATVLLIVITVGVADLVVNLTHYKTDVVNSADSDTMIASMVKWMQTSPGCNAAIQGKTLPAVATPFSIAPYDPTANPNGFNGFSASGQAIQAGFQINQNNRLLINSMTIKDKGIPGSQVNISNVNYIQKVAQISISFESSVDQVNRQMHQRFIELPVLLDATNTIQQCLMSTDLSQACTVMGGTFSNGICVPAQFCQIKGSYTTVQCTPNDSNCPTGTNNPYTNAQSCSPGFVAAETGKFHEAQSYSTSKGKGTETVDELFSYEICQRCCPGGVCP